MEAALSAQVELPCLSSALRPLVTLCYAAGDQGGDGAVPCCPCALAQAAIVRSESRDKDVNKLKEFPSYAARAKLPLSYY